MIVAATTEGVQEYEIVGDRLELLEGSPLAGVSIPRLAIDASGRWLAVDRNDQGVDVFAHDGTAWRHHATIPFSSPITWLSFGRDRILLTSLHEVRVYDAGGVLRAVQPAPRHTSFVRTFGHADGTRAVTLRLDQVLQEWWLDDERVLDEARRLAPVAPR